MTGQQHLQFDAHHERIGNLPKSLLPPPEGPQETDVCESEVASEGYSYGGLMSLTVTRRSGGVRPRKRPVLMLDDAEREQALRQMEVTAVQDFGEAVPSQRSAGLDALSPIDSQAPAPEWPREQAEDSVPGAEQADSAWSHEAASESSLHEPAAFVPPAYEDWAEPAQAEHDMQDNGLERAELYAENEEFEDDMADPELSTAWLAPMQAGDFAEEEEGVDEVVDEGRFGSLAKGITTRRLPEQLVDFEDTSWSSPAPVDAPVPVAAAAPEYPAVPEYPEVSEAQSLWGEGAVISPNCEPGPEEAVADAVWGNAGLSAEMADQTPGEPDQVASGHREAVRPAPAGHALRARVRSEREPVRQVSLIGRLLGWLRGLLRL